MCAHRLSSEFCLNRSRRGFNDVGGGAEHTGVDWGSVGSEHERWGLRTELGLGRRYEFSQRAGTSQLTTESQQKPELCPQHPLPLLGDQIGSPSSTLAPGPPPSSPHPHPVAHSCGTQPTQGRSSALALQSFPETRKQEQERKGPGSGEFSGPQVILGPTFYCWPPHRLDVWC